MHEIPEVRVPLVDIEESVYNANEIISVAARDDHP